MSASQTVATEGAKMIPPAAVLGAKLFGLTVDQWIQVLTVMYLLGLVVHQIPKHWAAACRFYRWIKGKFNDETA